METNMMGESTASSTYDEPRATDVVVIDDEESICEGCRQALEADGYWTATAPDGVQGLRLVEELQPRVVLVDLKMPGMSGVEVVAQVSQVAPGVVPIVITGYGSIESAVETMRIGASDFITKPFTPEKLLGSVRHAMALTEAKMKPEVAAPAARPAVAPEAAPPSKHSLLLQGLDAVGRLSSLGFRKREFLNELRALESEARERAERMGHAKDQEEIVLEMVHDLHVVDGIIQKQGYSKSALIQILLDVQTELNWLPGYCLRWISARLNVPETAIYGIANFYEAFALERRGAHLVQVCTGTACHVRGAPRLVERVSEVLGVKPGETDAEMKFTLQTVHCLGCCALGPVMVVDGNYYSDPSTRQIAKIMDACN